MHERWGYYLRVWKIYIAKWRASAHKNKKEREREPASWPDDISGNSSDRSSFPGAFSRTSERNQRRLGELFTGGQIYGRVVCVFFRGSSPRLASHLAQAVPRRNAGEMHLPG